MVLILLDSNRSGIKPGALQECFSEGKGNYMWWPYSPTGGSLPKRKSNSPVTWTCKPGTTTTIGNSTYIVKESVVNWKGFFTIAGVGVNAVQENSTTHTFSVVPDRRERAPRYCGDNDDPYRADRAKEVG